MNTNSIAPGGAGPVEPSSGPAAEPQPIDGARALQLLREVVAERPDYVYERDSNMACHYVRNGKPSCVVGHVLIRAGRPIELLKQNNTMLVGYLDRTFDLEETARIILSAAQDSQDQGMPWSQALSHAEATATQLGVSA